MTGQQGERVGPGETRGRMKPFEKNKMTAVLGCPAVALYLSTWQKDKGPCRHRCTKVSNSNAVRLSRVGSGRVPTPTWVDDVCLTGEMFKRQGYFATWHPMSDGGFRFKGVDARTPPSQQDKETFAI